jgi:Flp pilus assembly pilin Flp
MARRSTRARRGRRIPHSFSLQADPQDEAYGKPAAAPMPPDMATSGWFDRIRSRCRREVGQTMAEYAVVLGVIVPAIVISYAAFSDDIARLVDSVRSIL